MSGGVNVFVIVKDTHHRRSPLAQGGLEIPVKVTEKMETSSENSQAMERFKELVHVHRHYKKPVNGQFDDCTKEVLPEQSDESSDEENTS